MFPCAIFWECINSGMDYWNDGIMEWNFLKLIIKFLHPNKAQISKGSLFTHYASLSTKMDHIYLQDNIETTLLATGTPVSTCIQ